jgi:hypothetical protein
MTSKAQPRHPAPPTTHQRPPSPARRPHSPPLQPAPAGGDPVSVSAQLFVPHATCREPLAGELRSAEEAYLKAQPSVVAATVAVTVACTDLKVAGGAGSRAAARGPAGRTPSRSGAAFTGCQGAEGKGRDCASPHRRRRANLKGERARGHSATPCFQVRRLSRRLLAGDDPGVVYETKGTYTGR